MRRLVGAICAALALTLTTSCRPVGGTPSSSTETDRPTAGTRDVGALLHGTRVSLDGALPSDVVVLQESNRALIGQIRRSSPSTRILLYQNIAAVPDRGDSATGPSVVTAAAAQRSPGWALHSASGAPVRWHDFPYLQPMDTGDPGYQRAALAKVRQELAGADWDGVFLDDVLSDTRGHTYSAEPADITGGTQLAATTSFLLAVAAPLRSDGHVIAINAQQSRGDFEGPLSAWSPLVDLVMLEHFVAWGDSPLDRGPRQRFDEGQVRWRLREMALIQQHGAGVLALTYGSADDGRTQAFHRGVYLLGDSRPGASMWTIPTASMRSARPAADLDLGAPTASAREAAPGVWVRPFAEGWLVVNARGEALRSSSGELGLGSTARDVEVGARTAIAVPSD